MVFTEPPSVHSIATVIMDYNRVFLPQKSFHLLGLSSFNNTIKWSLQLICVWILSFYYIAVHRMVYVCMCCSYYGRPDKETNHIKTLRLLKTNLNYCCLHNIMGVLSPFWVLIFAVNQLYSILTYSKRKTNKVRFWTNVNTVFIHFHINTLYTLTAHHIFVLKFGVYNSK